LRPLTTEILTARLALEPWRPEDLDALHALWIDADVRRYLWDGEVMSRERAEATVRAGIE
jgi:RimJ/RimL family protein N-acetyltransferase